MTDINEIEMRNIRLLNQLITKLKIPYTIEELLTDFKSVYIHEGTAGNRLRILGAKATINATKKTKNVQLYTLKKKYIDKLDKDNLDFVKLNVTVFIKLFKELQIIKDIKNMENIFVNDRYEECVNYSFNFFEV